MKIIKKLIVLKLRKNSNKNMYVYIKDGKLCDGVVHHLFLIPSSI